MLLGLRSLWEPSVTPAPTLPNRPGRVYKGTYPYWQKRKKPYWEDEFDREETQEEEELLAAMGIEMD